MAEEAAGVPGRVSASVVEFPAAAVAEEELERAGPAVEAPVRVDQAVAAGLMPVICGARQDKAAAALVAVEVLAVAQAVREDPEAAG